MCVHTRDAVLACYVPILTQLTRSLVNNLSTSPPWVVELLGKAAAFPRVAAARGQHGHGDNLKAAHSVSDQHRGTQPHLLGATGVRTPRVIK